MFTDKVAIVTGASSGIGKHTALQLAAEGAKVALVARREEILKEVQTEIKNKGGEAIIIPTDMRQIELLKNIVENTVKAFGKIDILINAAGVIATGSIKNTTVDDWNKMFSLNVTSVFSLSQLCVPYIIKTKGNIVNVSSITGLRAFPGVLSYCCSKAAVDQMTRCMALELGEDGVRVNAVNPGVVITNLHKAGGMDEKAYAEFLEKSKLTHPLGRAGNVDEVVNLITFLASEKASWITGVTYSVDGGRGQTCLR